MIKSFVTTRLSWESEELIELRKMKRLLIDIDMDYEKEKVHYLIDLMSSLENRLIIKDSNINKGKVCSHCEGHKIYVCEPCMIEWSDSIKEVKIND